MAQWHRMPGVFEPPHVGCYIMPKAATIFSTAFSAVRPCFLRRTGTLPCSTNSSGQPMRTTGVWMPRVVEVLDDGAAEAVVQDVILEGADDLALLRKSFEHGAVERLDPARVDERGADPALREQFAGLRGHLEHVAEADERDVSPSASTTSALPISSSTGLSFGFAPVPDAARVADGDGARRRDSPSSRACRRTRPRPSAACGRGSGCGAGSRCRRGRGASGRRRR